MSTLFPYTTLFRFWLDNVGDLAYFHLDVIAALGLNNLHLVGHSLGGWIAAEIAVRDCHALKSLTLSARSEEHTSELQSLRHLVCRLLLEKKISSISKTFGLLRFLLRLSFLAK